MQSFQNNVNEKETPLKLSGLRGEASVLPTDQQGVTPVYKEATASAPSLICCCAVDGFVLSQRVDCFCGGDLLHMELWASEWRLTEAAVANEFY